FVIGANPASNHPRFVHQLKACRDRGGQVIVINPAKEPGLVKFAVPKSPGSLLKGGTWIASKYVQPKINGDLALLNGIAKALIEEEAIDTTFIESFTIGFKDLKDSVEQYSWADLCDASGVDEHEIRDISNSYAKSNNAVFAWGMGITHHLNGVNNVEAIANLALMRGMVGKPAAGLLPLRGHSNVQGIGSVGVKPGLTDATFGLLEKNLNMEIPTAKGMDTMACLEAAKRGEVDAALLMGGNLYAAAPDSEWTADALNQIGFKVSLTTTLNQGHINGIDSSESLVLPVTARDEEWQPTTQESMFNFVRYSRGGINRIDTVRPEVHILSQLGRRLCSDGPIDFAMFEQHDNVRSAIASVVPEFKAIADKKHNLEEFTIPGRVLHEPKFPTENGLARFMITMPDSLVRNSTSRAFTLASIRSEGQFNSIIYEEKDSYRGTDSRDVVLMNQSDIASMGLNEGARVTVRSDYGIMPDLEVVAFDIKRGCVLAYYPEANVLIGRERDPRSHTPAFKSISVDISAN
ncbi:MAG: molybdopterin-dependent oxidoreductase, partial [Pseudomonadales bacterium]|nr:molybdopterin-dependent oxidoreductase [Pseudomonadales bacterium]